MGDKIYYRYVRVFTATAFPKRGPWFGKFMRGSKMRMGYIKNQDFGITCKVEKPFLERWEKEWK